MLAALSSATLAASAAAVPQPSPVDALQTLSRAGYSRDRSVCERAALALIRRPVCDLILKFNADGTCYVRGGPPMPGEKLPRAGVDRSSKVVMQACLSE